VKDKALCKNGFFRWRNFKILPTTNFMNLNEKCKPDWKRKKNFKKKNMYSFLCCTSFTLTKTKNPIKILKKQNKQKNIIPFLCSKKEKINF